MDLLIKNAHIVDDNASNNNKITDILIENGIITAIENDISKNDIECFHAQDTFVSPGWVEIFSDFADPGFEHKETITSGALAAVHGGFTKVLILPNTSPSVQNKASVEYVVNKAKNAAADIIPLGAVSPELEGKDLAEMYDMAASGSRAFSDGKKTIQSAGLLVKALQYIKTINGLIITQPVESTFGSNGLMNEGIVSTQLGLPGMPAVAEHIMIMRDIELLRYTNSRLHITGISTAKSVELISNAKKDGLNITCSVTPYHLLLCDEDLTSYDTNLKLNTPLRNRSDRDALRDAVRNGLIDSIAVHHFPQHLDDKDCEFEYAKNGMIGLQTAYPVVKTALPELTPLQIVKLFSLNSRSMFDLPAKIEKGQPAELTVFSTEKTFIFTKEINKSKSTNSPFFGRELKGRVEAVFAKNNFYIN